MIRFRIGDHATLSTVPHSAKKFRGWQCITELSGRAGEQATIAGKSVNPLFFVHVLGVVHAYKDLQKFQVLVKTSAVIVVSIQLKAGWDAEGLEIWKSKVAATIQSEISPNVGISWQIVDDIPPTASGKHAYVVTQPGA